MIPPLRGARIEHVLVEREEIQGALGRSLERAVEDGRIGVDPNDSPGSGAEGELGKVARVASEIEQKIRTGVADEGEHGLTLRAELLRVISVMTIVCTPLARTRRGGAGSGSSPGDRSAALRSGAWEVPFREPRPNGAQCSR